MYSSELTMIDDYDSIRWMNRHTTVTHRIKTDEMKREKKSAFPDVK